MPGQVLDSLGLCGQEYRLGCGSNGTDTGHDLAP